eukprot:CAMPEP_0178986326 /NCGR_PEP_ID=MMETSP0795-20121207/2645_1 /TAXON_ID=88552 /ORGANISM="Amoebophrya sp., Strain Ameob2" /LENGTH=1018 /DNA_ID=CAMNT_0020677381 /DNA_START=285 /DNA_END=3341 /DNA_ORIENTATION=+
MPPPRVSRRQRRNESPIGDENAVSQPNLEQSHEMNQPNLDQNIVDEAEQDDAELLENNANEQSSCIFAHDDDIIELDSPNLELEDSPLGGPPNSDSHDRCASVSVAADNHNRAKNMPSTPNVNNREISALRVQPRGPEDLFANADVATPGIPTAERERRAFDKNHLFADGEQDWPMLIGRPRRVWGQSPGSSGSESPDLFFRQGRRSGERRENAGVVDENSGLVEGEGGGNVEGHGSASGAQGGNEAANEVENHDTEGAGADKDENEQPNDDAEMNAEDPEQQGEGGQNGSSASINQDVDMSPPPHPRQLRGLAPPGGAGGSDALGRLHHASTNSNELRTPPLPSVPRNRLFVTPPSAAVGPRNHRSHNSHATPPAAKAPAPARYRDSAGHRVREDSLQRRVNDAAGLPRPQVPGRRNLFLNDPSASSSLEQEEQDNVRPRRRSTSREDDHFRLPPPRSRPQDHASNRSPIFNSEKSKQSSDEDEEDDEDYLPRSPLEGSDEWAEERSGASQFANSDVDNFANSDVDPELPENPEDVVELPTTFSSTSRGSNNKRRSRIKGKNHNENDGEHQSQSLQSSQNSDGEGSSSSFIRNDRRSSIGNEVPRQQTPNRVSTPVVRSPANSAASSNSNAAHEQSSDHGTPVFSELDSQFIASDPELLFEPGPQKPTRGSATSSRAPAGAPAVDATTLVNLLAGYCETLFQETQGFDDPEADLFAKKMSSKGNASSSSQSVTESPNRVVPEIVAVDVNSCGRSPGAGPLLEPLVRKHQETVGGMKQSRQAQICMDRISQLMANANRRGGAEVEPKKGNLVTAECQWRSESKPDEVVRISEENVCYPLSATFNELVTSLRLFISSLEIGLWRTSTSVSQKESLRTLRTLHHNLCVFQGRADPPFEDEVHSANAKKRRVGDGGKKVVVPGGAAAAARTSGTSGTSTLTLSYTSHTETSSSLKRPSYRFRPLRTASGEVRSAEEVARLAQNWRKGEKDFVTAAAVADRDDVSESPGRGGDDVSVPELDR